MENNTVNDVLLVVKSDFDETEVEVKLMQQWAIRNPRPIIKREPISIPLITGQRVIDTMFPIAKGGSSAIPGALVQVRQCFSTRLPSGVMRISSSM